MSTTHKKIEQILKAPSDTYEQPEDVMSDPCFTVHEKHKILISWKQDLKALLRAEAENMPREDASSSAAERLKRVSKILSNMKKTNG